MRERQRDRERHRDTHGERERRGGKERERGKDLAGTSSYRPHLVNKIGREHHK